MQRLEFRDHRPHVLTQLDLSEEDADGPVTINEEVGALTAGPAVAAALWPFCLHTHTESPAHLVPETGEEAVRRLAFGGHLVAGHLLQVVGRDHRLSVDPTSVGEHPCEAVEVS